MKKRILIYFALFILAGASIAGIFISETAQYYYKLQVESKLKTVAGMVSKVVYDELDAGANAAGNAGNESFYENIAREYAVTINSGNSDIPVDQSDNVRITFLDFNGKVLGDSMADFRGMENHLGRREIDEAVKGLTGIDTRFSATVNMNLMYVAFPDMKLKLITRISIPLSELGKIDTLLWTFTIAGILAGLVLTVFFAIRITDTVTNPVKGLVSVSHDITRGDYSKRVKVESNDEWGELSENINEMAAKLGKLEKIRTEFVTNVTHELKTPLTSIRGFVETLRNGALNDAGAAAKFLMIIDIEAERLNNLINDILYLSEIETGVKDGNIAMHLLKPIVEEVASMLGNQAEKRNIGIYTEIEDMLQLTANRDRIKQLLINLIDNAVKYNIDGGSVIVKAWRDEGNVLISVKDTGIGIPEEYQERIFERFYRVDKGRSRSMGGTGLGLSIVKHIVNLYNGDIHVKSQSGKGTEFTVRLPEVRNGGMVNEGIGC